ncbi:MAG: Protease HtpX [Phycisphaerae bacterium]|nr:Protease HtpX [Phycisphaerae bacterium]
MRLINHLKTTVLLASLMGICMTIGYFISGPTGVILGFVFGGVGNLIAYFFSDRIALATMGAQQVTRAEAPWLHDTVERLAQRADLPMPRLYVCPQPAPNAFATGRNPANAAVAVTQGLLRGFPPHEVEGVLAHEIAHIKHRDVLISTIAATLAGIISYAAYMSMYVGGGASRENSNPLGPLGAVLAFVLAPIAATLIQLAISRQREFAADSYGGELCGDPLKLAAALARLESANQRIPTDSNPSFNSLFIVEPFLGEGVATLFATHPPTARRIAALREQAEGLRGKLSPQA